MVITRQVILNKFKFKKIRMHIYSTTEECIPHKVYHIQFVYKHKYIYRTIIFQIVLAFGSYSNQT